METAVIIFLLITGALCIVGQIASTFFAARKREAEAKPAAASARAKPKPAEGPSEPSLMDRVGAVIAAADDAGARLGVLGVILMLIAVALVVNISFTFSVST